MRAKILSAGAAAIALLGSTSAIAQSEGDEMPSLICATTKVVECTRNGACAEVDGAVVDVPPLLRIDFGDNTVSDPLVADDDANARSVIEAIRVDGSLIVLQGTDPGAPDAGDARGWTATISEQTGELAVAAIDNGAGYMVFGSCAAE